jgi:hypothetical protein
VKALILQAMQSFSSWLHTPRMANLFNCLGQHIRLAFHCLSVFFVLGNRAKMVQDNTISVDDFVNEHPTPSQCLKCVLLNCFNVGTKIPSTEILRVARQRE